MDVIITADVGSTFTKLTAVDPAGRRVLGRARAFTTVGTDVMEGFEAARKELLLQTGRVDVVRLIAASSAAGGLAMVAVGLVPELTVQAARMAAANSGAKILKTYAFELNQAEVSEIAALRPDMILLSGGTDGGNKDVIIHNGESLAGSGLRCPVVAAGNKSAGDELARVFKNYPGQVIFCPNVMPEIDKPDIGPAREAIRKLFIANIIEAKGLGGLQKLADLEIIPTPSTVLAAAELLSRGTGGLPGVGDLLLFDAGGATTDVYSMARGDPTKPNVFFRGLPQPYAKRTVEGDLGLRYSLPSLAGAATISRLASRLREPAGTEPVWTEPAGADRAGGPAGGSAEDFVAGWLERCAADPGLVPRPGTMEKRLDDELARECVRLSLARHCGVLEPVWTFMGQGFVQTGKDLSGVPLVIGTGGPIIGAEDPGRVLGAAARVPEDLHLLKPASPRTAVDHDYILSAMGALARLEPEAALAIMRETLNV